MKGVAEWDPSESFWRPSRPGWPHICPPADSAWVSQCASSSIIIRALAWQLEGLGSSSAPPLTSLVTLYGSFHLSASCFFICNTSTIILPKADFSEERKSSASRAPHRSWGRTGAQQMAVIVTRRGPKNARRMPR